MKKYLALCLLLVWQIPQGFGAPKAVRFGTLIDGTGRVLKGGAVVVDKTKANPVRADRDDN